MSKEIQEIIRAVDALPIGEKAVLATVVDLKGSGYRRPGARMLIKSNGDAVGTVSGGCLEADVLERAKRVLKNNAAEIFTYDTTAEENSVFSLNMGCRGVLRVLLESVDAGSDVFARLRRSFNDRSATAGAVVITSNNSSTGKIGDRFFLEESEKLIEFENLDSDLRKFADSTSTYETVTYKDGDGDIEFAFEQITPPVQLIILGAGADAVPLAGAAFSLGWQVRVYDHRPAFLTKERFPNADSLIGVKRDAPLPIDADDRTAIVAMNHNYDRDKMALHVALQTNAFYVGALGPKKRTQQILGELADADVSLDLQNLRSPAGLDIGGDTPEAIAIAIIAEIQSVLKGRSGGPLMNREAPIYDRS